VIPAPTTATRTAHILPVVTRLPDEIRPIVTKLSSIVEELGDDVEVEHGPELIAFARGRRFALLRPEPPRRVDVELVLPDAGETERLRPADGDGATHRVSLAHEDEIDAELVTWLRDAYDAAAS
jgi:hypothetical protein